MIRVTENGIWMRQGDSGNIGFDGLPTDKNYVPYLSLFNEETQKIVKEFTGIFDQNAGSADFAFIPESTDDVPVGEYTYAFKLCYGQQEDTLIPEVTVEDGTIIEQAAPNFTIAVKRAEGTAND